MIPSKITGADRLKYNSDRPFSKEIIYYNYFTPTSSIDIPKQYIIPKGYWNVIEQLDNNDIVMKRVKRDTTLMAEVYTISNYETRRRPYEGHYQHYNTEVDIAIEEVTVKRGDLMVETDQPGLRYLLETLEPTAPDSFFNWNYFDTILQRKEGFSPYVWEDKAFEFLEVNPEIKKEFEARKESDTEFANNWYAQLDWIHKKSPNYEKSHLRYPIVRVGG